MKKIKTDPRNLNVIQVGGLAQKVLSPGTKGTVLGVTSGGIFLNSANKVLFITEAPYNSPYNIRVESIARLTSDIPIGDTWSVEGERIAFEKLHFQIIFESAQVWKPSPLTRVENSKVKQIKLMDMLLDRCHELEPNKGWLFLRDSGERSRGGELDSEPKRIQHLTEDFIANVRQRNMDTCLESTRPILGLGGGLTPSGDDWLTGFILYFARQNNQDQFLIDLGAAITRMAFEHTTKISANRIEAACQGWAEELFLEVLDHLFVSTIALPDEQVLRLVNFGHSSGVDTCVGIRGAISLK